MGFLNRGSERLGIYNAQNIDADTSYYGECGALRIACDAVENDRIMFEAMLKNDFTEMDAYNQLKEGAITESEIEAIQEANIGGIWSKIKEMVKKIAAKIKGLFQTFIAKVNSVIIRDNKKFVEKYKRDVLLKDLSKMKYKWAEPTGKEINTLEKPEKNIESCIDTINGADTTAKTSEIDEYISSGEFKNVCYGAYLGSKTTEEDFSKDMHDSLFKEMEETEGMSNSLRDQIMKKLVNSNDALDKLKKAASSVDGVFTKYLRKIDNIQSKMASTIPDGKGYADTDNNKIDVSVDGGSKKTFSYGNPKNRDSEKMKDVMMKRLTLLQRMVTQSQSVFSKISGCIITETKFDIAQCRRLFAKMVSFNDKSVHESAIFEAAAEEAAYYDIMSSFESPEME